MFKGTHQRPQISRALIPLIVFLLLISILFQLSQSVLVRAEQPQIKYEAVSASPLSVTKQDNLLVDTLGNGQANPGDTIQYSVVISNGTAADALNVLLTDTLDSNVTFVPGSLKTTPLAFDGAETTDENMAVILTLTGSDPDGDTLAFSIVSGPANGSLGSISSLTATSAAVAYTPDTGFSGSDSFIFRVTDNDAGTDTAVFTLTIDPAVDNPPTLDLDANDSSGAGGNNYNTSFVEDGGAVPVADTDVTITDDGANMETAVFTLTNHPDGSDESLSVNGALPGGLSATIAPTGFVITITGSTTLANYESAIRQVEYNNTSNTPTESNRTVTVVVNDGLNDSNAAIATITITASNDAPILDLDADDSTGATGGNVNVAFTEDAGAVTLSDGISINDVDDADLETAVITLTNVQDGTAESLSVNSGLATGFGINVVFGGNNQSITLTGTATRDEYRQVLETVMYDNSDDDPNSATRNVTFVVNDGDINSNTTTAYITITPVNDPPGATDDTYNDVIGNTLYAVGIVMPPSPVVTATGTVLANDTDPEMGGLAVTAFDNPSVQGGAVAMQIDGTFTYLPPLGYEGTDSFTYTVTDGVLTQTATVNLTVTDVVWYIDNTAAGGGDGRSQTPFNSLANFRTAQASAGANDPETGDYIFIHEGTGDSTNLTGGITLLNDQQLIGQGVDLIVGGHTLVPAAANPIITNAAGNGINLAGNNTIRGLTIDSTSLSGITGSNVGNLTVSDTAVTNAGRLAVALANGTLNAAFTALSSNGSSSRGINLDNVSGSFTVSGNTTITGTGTEALRVVNSGSLTADFGNTTITNAGTDGVNLTGNVGSSFTFDTLSITTTGGSGLVADNSGTVNINDTGTTITAVAGAAVDIVNTAGQTNGSSGWTFAGLTSTNSSGDGVNLDTLSDNFTTSSTTTISGPTGSGINIQN
ncbi:MAG: cadherin-like domain-containing protein, partial [Anaerolineales bacterium]|nr:cadherin-like domain-containing protein [Anaerolineales bacterium]